MIVLRLQRGRKRQSRRFSSLAAARAFAQGLQRPVQLVSTLGYAESADGIVVVPISGCSINDLFLEGKHGT